MWHVIAIANSPEDEALSLMKKEKVLKEEEKIGAQ